MSQNRVSIFTPSHKSEYLRSVYSSIKDQDFYEWIILHNNGGTFEQFDDKRVKQIFWDGLPTKKIGALKKRACQEATGDILLELDHDDLLMPDAIELVVDAFKDDEVGFVFSNDIYTDMNHGRMKRFNPECGWEYRELYYNGYILDEPIAFEPTPSAVSRIWYAPDHLRAFRKDVYERIGGYNQDLEILDDLDLMCRMYLATKFHHINKALYVYRVHGSNTWIDRNKAIQDGVYPIHDKYIEQMILKWATDNKYLKLDLGSGDYCPQGYSSVDLVNADIVADLNNKWPFEDGSVGVIRAYDIFEHLKDPLFTMKELYRVLVPGGYALIQVPSTDGRGAFQDPTHVSFWNENSFLYYTNKRWSQYIGTPVKFQAIRLSTTEKDAIGVSWTMAQLLKITEGLRVPGPVFI